MPRRTKHELKDEVLFAYAKKMISRKVAAARLKELGYDDEWQINLYLDNDQNIPEDLES